MRAPHETDDTTEVPKRRFQITVDHMKTGPDKASPHGGAQITGVNWRYKGIGL